MPIRIDKVINPAASILLEGLIVFITYKILSKYSNIFKYKILEVFVISFSWRILYAIYITFMPPWMVVISPVRAIAPFLKFLLFEGAANALVISIIIKLSGRINELNKDRETYLKRLLGKVKYIGFLKEIGYMPIPTLALLIVAIFVQWVL